MTEFEMAYLANDTQLAITANASMLFTMLAGFLVASYNAAHRLSPLMIAVLIGIYAYAFLGTSFALERQMVNSLNLAGQIAARAASGNELQWHAAATFGGTPTAAGLRSVTPMINMAICVLIFIATIVFFFHCRRVNRVAEVEAKAKIASSLD